MVDQSPLKIGIAGLGTVGRGVFKILEQKAKLLELRAGRPLMVTAVSGREKSKSRGINLKNLTWYDNIEHLAGDPEIDLIVELIGGASGPAYELCKRALKAKKSLVTANKALIALHGAELAGIAENHHVGFAFEAAVAGGIPIIKTIKESLAANNIISLAGILNGTCNFILTKMQEEKKDFSSALKEAQGLGYAEADPSFDIEGTDAAHKLAILSALAFGCPPNFESIYIEGIKNITPPDIEYAGELGYVIKLLAIASLDEHEGKQELEQRVHPCLIPKSSDLAQVHGVLNGILLECDSLGKLFLEGAGAGEGPTASAVIADIIDTAAGRGSLPFNMPVKLLQKIKPAKMSDHQGAYYLRLKVSDEPGVVAAVTTILKDKRISLDSLLQKPVKSSATAQVVLTTHQTTEETMLKAVAAIAKIPHVLEPPHMIRIEEI